MKSIRRPPAHYPTLPSECIWVRRLAGRTTQANVLVMRGEDVLSVRRVSNGLAVFAKVASDDGRVVAEIVDNRFYINPNNFLRMDQPDSHSLVVYDQKGNKVLDIKYLNPRSVRILGEFRAPGAVPLFITSDQLRIGRGIQ